MPGYSPGGGPQFTFGRNQYLRSNSDVKTDPYMCAADSVPTETINGDPTQKILQPGTVMAKITSGPSAGMIGPFQAGVADGRENTANIVGIDDTFLPWQLRERDVEVAVVYEATCVQAWCFELDATGARIPLSNATADAMRGTKGLNIMFK